MTRCRPAKSSEDSLIVRFLKRIDIFTSRDDNGKVHGSIFSGVATLVAIGVLIVVTIDAFRRYSQDDLVISYYERARQPDDVVLLPPRIGAITFFQPVGERSQPFYNESYFRWNIRYRAIMFGDQQRSVHPRVYVDTAAVECTVYDDLLAGLDGKHADGCLNQTAIADGLREVRESRDDTELIPTRPVLQGKYGEKAYWFVEMSLVSCSSYGPAEGIECVNETVMLDEFSRGELTVDLVMHAQLTREQTQWSNIYLNVDPSIWQGIETFVKSIESYETGRLFPEFEDPLHQFQLEGYSTRTQARVDENFISFYLRVSDLVGVETVKHTTLFDTFAYIGGLAGLILMMFSVVFVNLNEVFYGVDGVIRRKNSLRSLASLSERRDSLYAEAVPRSYSEPEDRGDTKDVVVNPTGEGWHHTKASVFGDPLSEPVSESLGSQSSDGGVAKQEVAINVQHV